MNEPPWGVFKLPGDILSLFSFHFLMVSVLIFIDNLAMKKHKMGIYFSSCDPLMIPPYQGNPNPRPWARSRFWQVLPPVCSAYWSTPVPLVFQVDLGQGCSGQLRLSHRCPAAQPSGSPGNRRDCRQRMCHQISLKVWWPLLHIVGPKDCCPLDQEPAVYKHIKLRHWGGKAFRFHSAAFYLCISFSPHHSKSLCAPIAEGKPLLLLCASFCKEQLQR